MEAFIFHRDTGEWTQVEGMSLGRRNKPTCGLVDTGSEKYVVVTGGNNETCTCQQYPPCDFDGWMVYGCCDGKYKCVGEHLTSVETFSLKDKTWQRGKVNKNELVASGQGM